MARTSMARNRSVVGQSREAKISVMVQSGFSNDEIMAAMEKAYPEIIAKDDIRRDKKHKKYYLPGLPDFDQIARQRTQEAIRSTRKQDFDKNQEIDDEVGACGQGEAKPVNEYQLENLSRFLCGVPALDYIYGKTSFVHTSDHPDSEYITEDAWDFKQQKMIKVQVWKRGKWKKCDPMIPDGEGWLTTRDHDGKLIADLPLDKQKVEHGMPESFLSIWAGSHGVGKSRLAIALCNACNVMERKRNVPLREMRPVLYFNGEAPESQFRQWCRDVDPDLFIANTSNIIQVDKLIEDIYTFKPHLVVVDSLQMIAEYKKGNSSQDIILNRFNRLKQDEEAGKPHILFISQLNKQEQIAGRQLLAHMVDLVAVVTKYEGRKGTFLFEVPKKNRAGETPRAAIFRHTENTVECVSTEMRNGPQRYKLIQPTNPVPIPVLENLAPTRREEE